MELLWPAAVLIAGFLLGLACFQVLRRTRMSDLTRKEADLSARLRTAELALSQERAAHDAAQDDLKMTKADLAAACMREENVAKDLAEIKGKYEAALSMADHAGVGITTLRSENKALKTALAARQAAPPDQGPRLAALERALDARDLRITRLERELAEARARATRVVPALPTTETPAAKAVAAPPLNADDLTRIKGIGKVLSGKLQGLGITTFRQIADFTDDDVARLSRDLKLPGRIEREKWIEQARGFVEDAPGGSAP